MAKLKLGRADGIMAENELGRIGEEMAEMKNFNTIAFVNHTGKRPAAAEARKLPLAAESKGFAFSICGTLPRLKAWDFMERIFMENNIAKIPRLYPCLKAGASGVEV